MNIVIIDDHALSRVGLRHLLARSWPDATISEGGSFAELKLILDAHAEPDLILLDLGLPDIDGMEGLALIHQHHGPLPVAILSATHDPESIRTAMMRGASGYIPKALDAESMAMAIALILDGGTYFPRSALTPDIVDGAGSRNADPDRILTQRQREILQLVAVGKTNQSIAKQLGVSTNTVRAHVSAIFRELGVSNRTEAAHAANRMSVADTERGPPKP